MKKKKVIVSIEMKLGVNRRARRGGIGRRIGSLRHHCASLSRIVRINNVARFICVAPYAAGAQRARATPAGAP
jgi:hypothetical protein